MKDWYEWSIVVFVSIAELEAMEKQER